MRLRPYKSVDSIKITSWLKDEKTFNFWGGDHFGNYPITAKDIDNKYLVDNGDCKEEDNFYPWVLIDDEDNVVGHFIMRYINGDKNTLRFGWVIVDYSNRSKGIGTKMLRLGLKYAFEIMDVNVVTIGVFKENDLAHNCYLKVGFKDKEVVNSSEGKIIEMAMTKDEYFSLRIHF